MALPYLPQAYFQVSVGLIQNVPPVGKETLRPEHARAINSGAPEWTVETGGPLTASATAVIDIVIVVIVTPSLLSAAAATALSSYYHHIFVISVVVISIIIFIIT